MRQVFVALIVVLLAGPPSFADQADELSVDYRRLCQVKGHFQGGPEWVASVDSWGGEKHLVMNRLRQLLGNSGSDAQRIRTLMGEPQSVTSAGPGNFPVDFGPDEVVLCYHWRGSHDFLYFVISTDSNSPKVHKSGWWMAWE